ncbi:hypothetical protein DPMN_177584 [Dreissena polymorpha]|uniref:Uncharacterized protein n=1 Tax=Dreissena polymorpha TaxID=45954 RepID=A0A9D4EAK2_DREPO|nr:hypothetical protein DPMN_177584 [Dreissena polymorpha]
MCHFIVEQSVPRNEKEQSLRQQRLFPMLDIEQNEEKCVTATTKYRRMLDDESIYSNSCTEDM